MLDKDSSIITMIIDFKVHQKVKYQIMPINKWEANLK